jgi:hypothetical protein
MAGQSRTLKLALLADVANFTKDLGKAGNSTKTLGDQASEFGKKAALAFAAAGAVKKSVDPEDDEELAEEALVKSAPTSFWRNTYLPQELINSLGYRS